MFIYIPLDGRESLMKDPNHQITKVLAKCNNGINVWFANNSSMRSCIENKDASKPSMTPQEMTATDEYLLGKIKATITRDMKYKTKLKYSFTIHLLFIYYSFIIHLLFIYYSFTIHLSSIYHLGFLLFGCFVVWFRIDHRHCSV